MKKTRRYLTLIAGALLLTACSNDEAQTDDSGYKPSSDAIGFDAAYDGTDNAQTRASGDIFNDATLQGKAIGVFASYTGNLKYENTTVSSNFMWNQEVTYNSTDKWNYTPVKYWPNAADEYVSFFAYAPYEATPGVTKCISDISDKNTNGDPWVNYRLATNPWPKDETGTAVTPNQIDLLYGVKNTSGVYTPWTDVKRPGISDKVNFTFKHALACIGNQITIATNSELNGLIKDYSKVIIYGIKIEYNNLTTKARLVLNSGNGSPNWKEIISGELTTTRTYLNMFASGMTFDGTSTDAVNIPYLNAAAGGAAPAAESTEGDGLFYIPMQVSTEKATATVTLYYRVNILANDSYIPAAPAYAEAKATFDIPINNMEGKKQGIALTLGKDYELLHLVYTLGGTATDPSYSPKR